jgi:hypothetical protein
MARRAGHHALTPGWAGTQPLDRDEGRESAAAGTQYTLADGSLVRVMEPSGRAGLRASLTNASGGPINPFTGKPVQPPPDLSRPERLDYIRSRTHIELGP